MPLSVGDKLGHYEILSLLGKGGMGEVYRGRDTKLKRDVAIKVLPEAFARDAVRMARFQREAEVLASLNHSNIAAIYGVEDRALVMELVEGTSPKGPLSFDDAWKIASQMAAALEYAHDKGIIHRDLKPANIMVTPEGVVKLLDFGLAKAFTNRAEARTAASDSPENSPTLTIGATEVGVILGTAAYMPPEQAKGKAVDKRADIWSFAVVLYELLTGERLFKGEDVSDTLAQVLTKEPILKNVPPKARKLLSRCLEKDPQKRLRDIGEAAYLIEDAAVTAPSLSRFSKLPWIAAAVLAILAAGASWIAYRATRPTAAAATTRLSITVPANRPVSIPGVPTRSLAISPDGTQLVYVGTAPADRPGGRGQLQLRSLAGLEVRDLPGTEGGTQPFFSPDGQWVAFFTSTGELKKISLAGGNSVTLVQKINGSKVAFGLWTEDNNIIFGTASSGLRRVSAEGGEPTDLTTLVTGHETFHSFPVLVPSSRAVLFCVRTSGDSYRIEGVMLDSGKRRVVVENARVPIVLSSGHLLFQRDETILIAPFDPTRLSVNGPAVPLIDKVRSDSLASPYPIAELAVSQSGTLAYMPAADTAGALGLVGRDGAFQPLGLPPNNFDRPRVSPDGRYIAFMVARGQDSEVHVYDLQRGSTTKLTRDSRDSGIAWHPDSRSLAIFSQRKDARGIFLKNLDGGERLLVPLPAGVVSLRNFSWAPNGKQLAYTVQTGLLHDIWVLTMGEKPTSQPFLNSAVSEFSPKFSPDGLWLAYVSDESGRSEVYAQKYPQGERLPVSTGGGESPVWRRDGKELYFNGVSEGVPKMMAVAVTPDGASLRLAKPVPLFDLRVTGPTGVIEQYVDRLSSGAGYDILPDGRFVMVRGPDPIGTREIVLVLNWFEELKRLAPGK